MEALNVEPRRLPPKAAPSGEQMRAYRRSLHHQFKAQCATGLDAMDRALARRRHQRELAANEEAEVAAAEHRHVMAEEVGSAEMQQETLRQTVEGGEQQLRALEAEVRSVRARNAHGEIVREEASLTEMADALGEAQQAQALVDAGSVCDQIIAELYDR